MEDEGESTRGEVLLNRLLSFLRITHGDPGGFNFKSYQWNNFDAVELANEIEKLILYRRRALGKIENEK